MAARTPAPIEALNLPLQAKALASTHTRTCRLAGQPNSAAMGMMATDMQMRSMLPSSRASAVGSRTLAAGPTWGTEGVEGVPGAGLHRSGGPQVGAVAATAARVPSALIFTWLPCAERNECALCV